jgi:acyl-coenzyme A thioesterase PaaI-like protein
VNLALLRCFPAHSMTLPTPTVWSLARLKSLRAQAHPLCVVCSPKNPLGLGLEFTVAEDGSVEGTFAGSLIFEGYSGLLHGGVIASLLDGAMTNCLFAHGCESVTAELNVRYRHPVVARETMIVRAWRQKSIRRLHLLRAELKQNGLVKATARAKFMEHKPENTGSPSFNGNEKSD